MWEYFLDLYGQGARIRINELKKTKKTARICHRVLERVIVCDSEGTGCGGASVALY